MVTLRSFLATAASAVVFVSFSGVPQAIGETFHHAPRAPRTPTTPPVFTGQAFDSCSAPALGAMRAWWSASPYRAVGVYIGGVNRACVQPELSRSWVRAVDRIGWRILPVYVGSQAPCLIVRGRAKLMDPRHTLAQGRAEGADAVRAAAALGLAPGSPVYLDIESYRRREPACTLTVLQYTTAWTAAVRAKGYVAGFYSSDDSGIADLAAAEVAEAAQAAVRGGIRLVRHPNPHAHRRARPGRPARPTRREHSALPDAVWYARWNAHPGTTDSGALGPAQWAGGRRVHQYRGNAKETYGGVTQWVDRDSVDAPVAVVGT